ncbi:MAG: hypothetical protein A2919_01085 [Candidatus Spechtbacteria bacterium RIFCSPLOWO2_01_FULL_43_12]|uniref:Uncharacterized protein n=1 Tax=Candidatus Spechtbacteria bacterium RIFCSPLOWO2_01_FULL_43_12 TaxID=1802162 RepID=A0A1G2HE22_9BACT|nr:MAG: hypothetical protein A2919_01085 [Candidatus Spechtbacteria bacterium RIFCSPLOWO2_01_FULL_43_12]
MQKKVAFISGLGGTGKTAVYYYFLENPVKTITFYDFDKGKYKSPPHNEDHLKWRANQNNWWLEVANKEYEVKGNITVVLGLCLYPRQIPQLPNAKYFEQNSFLFGHLTCDHEVRKERLFGRGNPDHWEGVKPWYEEFFQEMKGENVFEIDTTNSSVEEVALKIKDWIKRSTS